MGACNLRNCELQPSRLRKVLRDPNWSVKRGLDNPVTVSGGTVHKEVKVNHLKYRC